MDKTLFNGLQQSLLEAGAIARGEAMPSRYFKLATSHLQKKGNRKKKNRFAMVMGQT